MTSSASGPSGGRDAPSPAAPAPSSRPPADRGRGIWTARQRLVLIGFLSILIAALAIRFWLNPAHVSDPQPARPVRADELADRIDPNTALWEQFAVLPGIGEVRAREIVAYRDAFLANNPGRRAFERPDDLRQVRGIGMATQEAIEPYLIFPEDERAPPAR